MASDGISLDAFPADCSDAFMTNHSSHSVTRCPTRSSPPNASANSPRVKAAPACILQSEPRQFACHKTPTPPPVCRRRMSLNSAAAKRRRSNNDDSSASTDVSSLELPPNKRARQHERPAYLTRLSDELFLRIASHLATRDLASFQRVSKRCQRIAVDSQVWRALYNKRFVRSRPSGLSRPGGTQTSKDWKGLYKLRHNWNSGCCGIREIDITAREASAAGLPDESSSAASTLVKLHEVWTLFPRGYWFYCMMRG